MPALLPLRFLLSLPVMSAEQAECTCQRGDIPTGSGPNCRCWGSLSCTVISPPDVDTVTLDQAVAGLRYGSVAVNAPSFAGYTFPKLPWGAFPGNTPQVSFLCAFVLTAKPNKFQTQSNQHR